MSKYKLVNRAKPHIVFQTSDNIADLWVDMKNYQHRCDPVIINNKRKIVAGLSRSYEFCKLQGFKV